MVSISLCCKPNRSGKRWVDKSKRVNLVWAFFAFGIKFVFTTHSVAVSEKSEKSRNGAGMNRKDSSKERTCQGASAVA